MSTEKIRTYLTSEIAVRMVISPRLLEVMIEKHLDVGYRVVTTIVNALERPVDEVEWPADWWQAFKARWFPEWLRARYPVRYEERRLARYCPHKAVLDDPGLHLTFLETGELAV